MRTPRHLMRWLWWALCITAHARCVNERSDRVARIPGGTPARRSELRRVEVVGVAARIVTKVLAVPL